MATNKESVFSSTLNYTAVSFVNADSTTAKTIFTPDSTDGGALMQINVTSSDTSDVLMQVNVVDGGAVSRLLGTVNVPTLSGTDGLAPSIDILSALDATGLPLIAGRQNDGSLLVKGGESVTVNPTVAVTATFTVDIIPQGGDYNV